mgnify:CR=1 FL=1
MPVSSQVGLSYHVLSNQRYRKRKVVQLQIQEYEGMVAMQCGERELEAGVDGKLEVNRAEDETLKLTRLDILCRAATEERQAK